MINHVKATDQIEDVLYHGKDTLYLYDSPLEKIDKISEKISDLRKNGDYSSDCWRGFRAEWRIINNTLYLANVYECDSDTKLNSIVERILGRKFKNGLIKADWVTGDFWAGRGFAPVMTLYISIYKHENKFEFAKGIIVSSEQVDCLPCDYSDEEKISEFVIQHLDLSKLPDLNISSIRLSVYLESDKTGKIKGIKIERSSDTRFNEPIIKALNELPCMPVYFHEGAFWDVVMSIDLIINNENLKKSTLLIPAHP